MRDIAISYYGHYKRIPPTISLGVIGAHELTIVISGGMSYRVGGVCYELLPGSAIFIPALSERERLRTESECDYVSFNFSSEVPELAAVTENACHSEVMLILSAIDRIAEKPRLSFYDRAAEMLAVIISLLENYSRTERMTALTLGILDYIHKNFRSRITLSDIASEFYFSPVYCESVFSSDMGQSVIDYVLDLRIQEAEHLIIEGDMTLSEIAERVGFTDYNYFSRTFKKRSGYTPTEYRRVVKPRL
jgi:YesN/AraC family two-component response regulator